MSAMQVACTSSQVDENYAVHVKSKEINDFISADRLSNQRVNVWLYGQGWLPDHRGFTNRSCDFLTFTQGEGVFTPGVQSSNRIFRSPLRGHW